MKRLLRSKWFWALVLILLATSSGCLALATKLQKTFERAGFIEEWTPQDGVVHTNVVYDKTNQLDYDLYVPTRSKLKSPEALILFIHGGAWNSGNKTDLAFACKRYAKQGYVSATLKYTLFSEKNKTEYSLDRVLKDIENCLEHIKRHMEKLGCQVTQTALAGYSAGGHLALLYAYKCQKTSPLPIRFVFQKVGPTDFHPDTWDNKTDLVAGLVSCFNQKLISQEDIVSGQAEELIRNASPVSFVTPESPPTVLAYGGKDRLVRQPNKHKLVQALKDNNVTHATIDFQNSGHILSEDPQARDLFTQEVIRFAEKYFQP